jgi:hypothetical protein
MAIFGWLRKVLLYKAFDEMRNVERAAQGRASGMLYAAVSTRADVYLAHEA